MSERKIAGNALGQLFDLLAQQRTMLKEGRFDLLDHLTTHIGALTDQIEKGLKNYSKNDISAVRTKANDNRRLLDAAREGITAAQNVRHRIFHTSNTLKTYDQSGHRSLLMPPTSALERRR